MAAQSGASRPTLVDRLFQAAYWLAFRAALLLWFVRRPAQDGYLAVIRHGGRALACGPVAEVLLHAGFAVLPADEAGVVLPAVEHSAPPRKDMADVAEYNI